MVLNGEGRYVEADYVRDHIRGSWEANYKQEWIAKGRPVAESSWSRVIVFGRDYYVLGAEYFSPRLLEGDKGDPLAITAYYKVIALREENGEARIFQLNKASVEDDYFLEVRGERNSHGQGL
jgi:hypothetical protein